MLNKTGAIIFSKHGSIPFTKFFGTMTKNFLTNTTKITFSKTSFCDKKLSEKPKQPFRENFSADKKLSTISWATILFGCHEPLHPKTGQHRKLSDATETSRKTNTTLLLIIQYCETKKIQKLLVTRSDRLPKLSRQRDELR